MGVFFDKHHRIHAELAGMSFKRKTKRLIGKCRGCGLLLMEQDRHQMKRGTAQCPSCLLIAPPSRRTAD